VADEFPYNDLGEPSFLPRGTLANRRLGPTLEDIPWSLEPPYGGAMAQSEGEREAHNWRAALPWIGALVPPVAAYMGGERIGRGWQEGDPLAMAMGLGQVGLAGYGMTPGAWGVRAGAPPARSTIRDVPEGTTMSPLWYSTLRPPGSTPLSNYAAPSSQAAAGAARDLVQRAGPEGAQLRGLPSTVAPEARELYGDLARHYAATRDPESLRLLQTMETNAWAPRVAQPPMPPVQGVNMRPNAPTQGQRDLYELTPAMDPREARAFLGDRNHRSNLDPVRSQRFWEADFEGAAPPLPRSPPGVELQRGQQAFHALTPEAAFPRIAGTTAEDMQHATMALRSANGDYGRAVEWLNGRRPGAESLLRTWQARGVDSAQASRYYRGLSELNALERPPTPWLNSLAPLTLGAGGFGASQMFPSEQ
jgi:hypothetical protein